MAYKPLYLEPNEEITSVIDKIAQTPDKNVVLVLAKNSALFQSLVNLKLLSKEAKRLGKQVALVSTNKVGTKLAKQVGIATYATVAALPATAAAPAPSVPATPDEVIGGVKVQQYDPNRQHAAEPMETVAEEPVEAVNVEPEIPAEEPTKTAESFEPITIQPEEPVEKPVKDITDLPPVISRSGVMTRKEITIPWRSVAVGAGIFLFICLLAYLFVPRANVVVTFSAEPLSETVAVSAITATDSQKANAVTGNKLLVTKEKTKPITATGKKDIGTKATGSIPIRNCEDSSSHAVAAGSKVTASGKTFLTDSAVTIPAGSFSGGGTVCNSSPVNVGLTADAAGEGHNLTGATFTINGLSTRISGTGSTSGGTAKIVTVLTQDDIDTAILALKKEAKDEAIAELTEKAAGQKLLTDGIWEVVSKEGADKAVGAQTETAVVSFNVEYGAIAFDEAAANLLFSAAFDGKISESQQVIFPEDAPPAFKAVKVADDKNSFDFEIAGTAYVVPKIDKNEVAAKVKNKSKDAVAGILQQAYGAESAEVTITPGWWIDRLPLLGQAISIEYGFLQQAETEESTGEPAA